MPHCCVALRACVQEPEHLAVKTIANTALTVRPNGAHHCMYAAGHTAVNTAFEAVEGPKSRVALHDRLVLHHYVTKSVEDYEAKMRRGSGMGRKKDWVSEARRGAEAAAAGAPPCCRACPARGQASSAQEPAALTLNHSTTSAPPLLATLPSCRSCTSTTYRIGGLPWRHGTELKEGAARRCAHSRPPHSDPLTLPAALVMPALATLLLLVCPPQVGGDVHSVGRHLAADAAAAAADA